MPGLFLHAAECNLYKVGVIDMITRVLSIGVLLFFSATLWSQTVDQEKRRTREWPTNIRTETFGFEDSSPTDHPWVDIIQGCQRRDCIPSIDQPKFVSASEATFMQDDDIVLAVALEGVERAYPTRILVFHEIVNDTVAGVPVTISYCPLCGSGLAFHRVLDGETIEFGVSGLLHNSDLIMYDRKSESLWQQIEGRAFAGPMRGRELEVFPMAMGTWKEWRETHPQTQVLSTDTGFEHMDYGNKSPYGDYKSSDRIMFPVALSDARLHPKRVVHGSEIDGQPVAYEQNYLQEKGHLSDQVGGQQLSIHYQSDGSVQISNSAGKQWTAHRMFWFAWYTFHPDTLLRDGD
jgi:hypothetical protein